MPDFRSYVQDLDKSDSLIELDSFESHHLVATNRAKQGDPLVLFNGNGIEFDAQIKVADKRKAIVEKIEQIPTASMNHSITLVQAVLKGKKLDPIIRQATELGVSRIQFITTERTQVPIKEASTDNKKKKWDSQAIEACKQSGNPWLPNISPVISLKNFLQESQEDSIRLVAALTPETQNWNDLTRTSNNCTILIGPEGDFSPTEYQLLNEAGFIFVSLGSNVLRSETAAISAITRALSLLEK